MTFIIEYLLRWYSHDLRPTYLLKWEMMIDLVAFLPFVLQQEGFLGFTFVRLLRILRLQRFLMDVDTFQRIIKGVIPWKIDVSEFELQARRIVRVKRLLPQDSVACCPDPNFRVCGW